jgi:hypothetical protein
MAEDSKPQPRQDAGDGAKREYRRPALIEYGPISKLTRSGGVTRIETFSPRMRPRACL